MSRVGQLAQDLSVAQERKGHLNQYLEANKRRFKNQRAARTGIEHGIKLLVFEELLGEKAISAVLSFAYDCFRRIKYSELAPLKATVDQTEWITALVKQKAGWVDGCQECYEGR